MALSYSRLDFFNGLFGCDFAANDALGLFEETRARFKSLYLAIRRGLLTSPAATGRCFIIIFHFVLLA
ncbi:protein of unknown function [Thiomonas sp. CB3]|nr:protein of unknown function [Thiomonas sp. CB3]